MLIGNTVLSGANEIIQSMQAGAMLKQFEGLGVSPVKSSYSADFAFPNSVGIYPGQK